MSKNSSKPEPPFPLHQVPAPPILHPTEGSQREPLEDCPRLAACKVNGAAEELRTAVSLLTATLESTADGLLAVDSEHRITLWNQRFLEMWQIPPEISGSRDDGRMIAYVRGQIKDPGAVARIGEIYARPEAESFDVVEVRDGRIFERYSRPQLMGGRPAGRVWSFRDVTARRRAEEALRESDQKFRALFDRSPIALTLVGWPSGRVLEINDTFLSTLGYARADLPRLASREVSVWADDDDRRRYFRQLAAEGSVPGFEARLRRSNGELFDALITGSTLQIGGETCLVNSMQDVSERKRAEAMRGALHKISEAVHSSLGLGSLFQQIHEIVGGLLPARNFFVALHDERSDEVSFPYFVDEIDPPPAPRQLGSRGLTEVVLRSGEALLLTPTSPISQKVMAEQAHGTLPLDWLGVPLRSPDRTLGALVVQSYTGEVRYTAKDKALLELIADQVTLAIERKRSQEKLLHDALHDDLTGLPNRTLFMDRLRQAMERSRREPERMTAVLFLDLDRFKLVNDSLGHRVGDQVLIEIADAFAAALRPSDTLARLGGDEFAVLLEGTHDAGDAVRVAERLQRSLATPLPATRNKIATSVSIGIAIRTPEYRRAEHLLRDADTAMYRAKATGRGRSVIFNRAMHRRVMARRRLEADLRGAVDGGQFQVHYQPFVDLASGEVVGFEALVRWLHPQRGLRLPADFLAEAEQTGLLVPIGRQVLAESCRQVRELQAAFPRERPLRLTVNLSHRQFFDPSLFEQIGDALAASGLDPECLGLEITESVIIDDPESATRRFASLKEMGVQLYLDDFGKGYSALNYLHRFPMDILKIDRSFISRIAKAERNLAIARAIVTLGQSLNMQVVAEGIETAGQEARLRGLGCDYGQGYLFSKPVPGDDLGKLLLGSLPPAEPS